MDNATILWISPFVPYNSVPHAGGKTELFYIRNIMNCNCNFNLITACHTWELGKIDPDILEITKKIIPKDNWTGLLMRIRNFIRIANPFDKYGHVLSPYFKEGVTKALRECQGKRCFTPDIIVLQWTEAVMLINILKKKFPKSRFIAIEEDVTYLRKERKYKSSSNLITKAYRKIGYNITRRTELSALNNSDVVIVNNYKDRDLLCKDGIEENHIFSMCPYYQDFSEIQRIYQNKTIVFYGAMDRSDNEDAAIWFIEKVFCKLENDFIFMIIGNHPSDRLKRYASDRIIITGFVDYVGELLSKAFCFVAPLFIGAGIKIKVLEAMSASLPVLTNEIGIEGIGATDGKEFFLCKTDRDYLLRIHELENEDINKSMGKAAKEYILSNFKKVQKVKEFRNIFTSLAGYNVAEEFAEVISII